MKKTIIFFLAAIIFILAGCNSSDDEQTSSDTAQKKQKQKTVAVIETSMGTIEAELFPDKTPETVENFIGLATGKREWIEYRTLERMHKPFFNGLIFHRVIPEFMIQTGDQKGNGTGTPGYKFKDEFVDDLKFDRPGRLGMANSGKDSNGSQFFITEVPLPHLNNVHTIFGQVISGMDVVKAIARVPRDARDKPLNDVILKRIRIIKR